MGGHNEPALMVATNKVGVAKQLSIRAEDGSVQTIAESTSPEAAEAWKQVIRADVCAYCAGPGGTIDHIVSRAMGGSSKSIRNWTGACAKCNGRRGSRGILYFLANTADNGAERRENIIKAAYHAAVSPVSGGSTSDRRSGGQSPVSPQRRSAAWRRRRSSSANGAGRPRETKHGGARESACTASWWGWATRPWTTPRPSRESGTRGSET